MDQKQRLLSMIEHDVETGCWNWNGALKGKGKLQQYGHLTVGSRKDKSRKTISAHRYSFKIFVGEIPNGLYVLHKCDNPRCINPEHLFLGTRQDNVNDRERKGRNKIIHYSGNEHPNHKLLESDIYEIRNSNKSSKELSKIFKVSSGHIRAIKRRESWKCLSEQPIII